MIDMYFTANLTPDRIDKTGWSELVGNDGVVIHLGEVHEGIREMDIPGVIYQLTDLPSVPADLLGLRTHGIVIGHDIICSYEPLTPEQMMFYRLNIHAGATVMEEDVTESMGITTVKSPKHACCDYGTAGLLRVPV